MIPYYCFALVSIVIYAMLGSKMEKTVGGTTYLRFRA